MVSGLMNDLSLANMGRALDHLSRYQQVIGTNIANIDTPGYKAETIEFDARLQDEMAKRGTLALERTHADHLDVSGDSEEEGGVVERTGVAARVDGNTVDVNVEMLELVETGLKYQTISQLTSKRLALYRQIATEG